VKHNIAFLSDRDPAGLPPSALTLSLKGFVKFVPHCHDDQCLLVLFSEGGFFVVSFITGVGDAIDKMCYILAFSINSGVKGEKTSLVVCFEM
jgi:hypothetical protein